METRASREWAKNPSQQHRASSLESRPIPGDWRANANNHSSNRRSQETESKSQNMERLKQDLLSTLNLKKNGLIISFLEKEFSKKIGKSADDLAEELGYCSFEELLNSKIFDDILVASEVETDYGRTKVYKAKQVLPSKPTQFQQMENGRNTMQKAPTREFTEESKAINEVGGEHYFSSKKIILKLLAENGGEDHPVSFLNLRTFYLVKTKTDLSKSELKTLFGNSHPLQVFQNLFSQEVKVDLDPTRSGIFYMQLKKPYVELKKQLKESLDKLKRPRPAAGRFLENSDPAPTKRSNSESDFFGLSNTLEKARVVRSPGRQLNESRSPSPLLIKDIPKARKFPSISTAAPQKLEINGIANISNGRYQPKDQLVQKSAFEKKPSIPEPEQKQSKKNFERYTSPGEGIYTDDEVEKVEKVEKAKGQPVEAQKKQNLLYSSDEEETKSLKGQALKNDAKIIPISDDDEEEEEEIKMPKERTNFLSHGEKWIAKSMDLENFRIAKEKRKLNRKISAMSEKLEELDQKTSNQPNNFLIKSNNLKETDRVVIQPVVQPPTNNNANLRLNDKSNNSTFDQSKISSKSSFEEEFENLIEGFEEEDSLEPWHCEPIVTHQPLKEVNGQQIASSSFDRSWYDDPVFLRLRIWGVQLKEMDSDNRRRRVMNEMEEVLHRSTSSNNEIHPHLSSSTNSSANNGANGRPALKSRKIIT